jgi:hypothetical protein
VYFLAHITLGQKADQMSSRNYLVMFEFLRSKKLKEVSNMLLKIIPSQGVNKNTTPYELQADSCFWIGSALGPLFSPEMLQE